VGDKFPWSKEGFVSFTICGEWVPSEDTGGGEVDIEEVMKVEKVKDV
jgi:hypothetical protein